MVRSAWRAIKRSEWRNASNVPWRHSSCCSRNTMKTSQLKTTKSQSLVVWLWQFDALCVCTYTTGSARSCENCRPIITALTTNNATAPSSLWFPTTIVSRSADRHLAIVGGDESRKFSLSAWRRRAFYLSEVVRRC